jgi:UDP-N-acetylmuramate dehydrogenase
MALPAEFAEFVRQNVPLAPFTVLKLGGPAEYLAQPRNRAELAALVRYCTAERVPLRVLGGGGHVIISDEGVRGVVLRLAAPEFTTVEVQGQIVRAGAGAALSAVISQAARYELTGLESLVGILGEFGGAIRCNVGDRTASLGQFVRSVEVLTAQGEYLHRQRDELQFGVHCSNIDDPVIVAGELQLEKDSALAIVKRMRKAWIQRKATQPYSFQASCRLFKNPRGESATQLIDQAGLSRSTVGGVELSERNGNYIVVHPGATSRDALRLIELIQSRVREATGVELEREVIIW